LSAGRPCGPARAVVALLLARLWPWWLLGGLVSSCLAQGGDAPSALRSDDTHAATTGAAKPYVTDTTRGVFSKAQAQRGKTAYTRNCQGCHSNNLQGEGIEPPLIGELFIDAWREDRLFSLYDYMVERMPKEGRNSTPGSLKPQQYVDILAFVLERNGFPAGPQDLALPSLGDIQFVGLEGAAALPASAMVRSVGCLQQQADHFVLEQASELTRVRVVDETDEHELALSREIGAGTLRFPLVNVLQAIPAADRLHGKRVQVKGILHVDADGQSLHVLHIAALGNDGC
jgi:mono/diheme cytochrome c family protein